MKKQTIRNFIQRQESHFKEKMDMSTACEEAKEEAFAERFMKFKAREYQNNTRMNVRNQEYAALKQKRDRALNYWSNNVLPNHLPPIDQKKRQEMIDLKKQATVAPKGFSSKPHQ